MAIIWPLAPFPQRVLLRTYTEEVADGFIRTDMDVGPAKQRKRVDRTPTQFSGSLRLKTTQCDDLDTFYQETVEWGSLSFEWTHPRTGSTGDFRFTKAPRYSVDGVDYLAAIEWEQLTT